MKPKVIQMVNTISISTLYIILSLSLFSSFRSLSLSSPPNKNKNNPFVKSKSGPVSTSLGKQIAQEYCISIELGVIKVCRRPN